MTANLKGLYVAGGGNWWETNKDFKFEPIKVQVLLKYVDELCYLFQKSCQKFKMVLHYATTG